MPVNRGSRHSPKWSGFAKYKSRRKRIGTHDSMEEFREAKERCLAELREEVANPSRRVAPTVLEFAGATIHENGSGRCAPPSARRRLRIKPSRHTQRAPSPARSRRTTISLAQRGQLSPGETVLRVGEDRRSVERLAGPFGRASRATRLVLAHDLDVPRQTDPPL
jgi:hypothetical protein